MTLEYHNGLITVREENIHGDTWTEWKCFLAAVALTCAMSPNRICYAMTDRDEHKRSTTLAVFQLRYNGTIHTY